MLSGRRRMIEELGSGEQQRYGQAKNDLESTVGWGIGDMQDMGLRPEMAMDRKKWR